MKIVTRVYVRNNVVVFNRKWPHGRGSFINSEFKVKEASLRRLHRTITKLVNKQKVTITLFNGGYEAICQ